MAFASEGSINRYYDPSTDQFLSVDPDVQMTDQPYVFTNDNPLNAQDPLGLMPSGGSGQTNAETLAIAKAYAAQKAANNAAAAKAAAAAAKAAAAAVARATSQAHANSAAAAAAPAAAAAQYDAELAASYLTQSSNITLNVFAPSPSSNVWNLGTGAASSAAGAQGSASSAESSANDFDWRGVDNFLGKTTVWIVVGSCVVFAGASDYVSVGLTTPGAAGLAAACIAGGAAAVGAS